MLTINDFKFFVVFVHKHCLCVRCCMTFDHKLFVFDIDIKNYVILCFDLNFNIFFEIFCFNFRNDRFFFVRIVHMFRLIYSTKCSLFLIKVFR